MMRNAGARLAGLRRDIRNDRQLVKLMGGTVSSFALNIAGTGLALLAQIILARILGTVSYGVYAYALSWLTVLVLFGRFGFDNTVIRYLAVHRGTAEDGAFWGLLRSSQRITLAASIAVGGLTAGVVFLLRERLETDLAPTLYLACAALPVWALLTWSQSSLRGLKHPILGQAPELMLRPVLMIAVVLAVAFSFEDVSAPMAMSCYLGTTAIAYGCATLALRWRLPGRTPGLVREVRYRAWFGMAAPMLMVGVLTMLTKRTDMLMLGAFDGTTDAGIYGAASRVGELVLYGLHSVNAIVAPMFAEMHARGERGPMQRLLTLTTWGIFGITIGICVFLAVSGPLFLNLFGPEFGAGYSPLLILIAGHTVGALFGPVGYLLTMTGHQNDLMRLMAAATIFNVALNAALIPVYGMAGAAIATASAHIAWRVAATAIVVFRLSINPTVFARSRSG